jgi:hypothetical protein
VDLSSAPSWTPTKISDLQSEETPKYDHGFSEEEVLKIKDEFKKLETRQAKTGECPSLDEFKSIVIPHCRIHRTEQFILNPVKVKAVKEPKIPKEKVAKVPKEKTLKVKKITQKEMKERQFRLQKIISLKAAGLAISESDIEFLKMMEVEF